MSLNKLKNVALGMAILVTAIGTSVESANAGRLFKSSGSAINSSRFTFELDTSVADSNHDESNGLFEGAIKNFEIRGSFVSRPLKPGDTSLLGNIKVSKLTIDSSGNVSNLLIDGETVKPNELLDPTERTGIFSGQESSEAFDLDFNSGDVIQYEVTFPNFTNLTGLDFGVPQLIWFVQSKDAILLNDLSGLEKFQRIFGLFGFGGQGTAFSFVLDPLPEPSKIPESNSIIGIIVVGAGLLRLKRANSQTE